jgi:hypothetical protein
MLASKLICSINLKNRFTPITALRYEEQIGLFKEESDLLVPISDLG